MKKIRKIKKNIAVQIAARHNRVSREIAANYTDSELRETLRHLNLKADF